MHSIKELRRKQNASILTDRECEFLCLAAMGFKNKQIAYILSVSKSTVKKTLENIFQKLFAKDRANAVAIAFIHDFLTPEKISLIRDKFFQQID
ncbi:MAG: helix-turn-helix transcriptional regulator, partial [Candidatus Gastranaerophilales bacterium]|nr:helix-turn-helix transcriptional regulator [Candidatus Gastranaerophilales bacterium]